MTGTNRELFGVFGGPDAFGHHADPGEFDRELLAEAPELHDAAVRFELRLDDLSAWLDHVRARCPTTDVPTDSVPSSVLAG